MISIQVSHRFREARRFFFSQSVGLSESVGKNSGFIVISSQVIGLEGCPSLRGRGGVRVGGGWLAKRCCLIEDEFE